jgi:hypothetical protein
LILLLEFTPLSGVASLADLFHLHQSGGTPADLAGVDPAILRGAQLCDGPARMDDAEYFNRAMFGRMAPGEGEMPVREFLGVLPPGLIYGIEVPFPAVTAGKLGPLEHATRLLEQARALQPQLRA